MEERHKNLENKIDKIQKEVNNVNITVARIETLLSEGIIRRIENIEHEMEEQKKRQDTRNKIIVSAFIPIIAKMIMDLIIGL